ncbi:hypothetical protein CsSME_00044524 [Camellia sinensis var. sinensis]
MEPFNTSSVSRTPSYSLKAKATSVFQEGISMHLSGWNGLQMAIQNKWGGSDSLKKFDQLTSDILSWFSQSKEQLHIEDLENLLHESLLLTFNTDIEDGSIEEVAEQLMIIHEEFLQGSHALMNKRVIEIQNLGRTSSSS